MGHPLDESLRRALSAGAAGRGPDPDARQQVVAGVRRRHRRRLEVAGSALGALMAAAVVAVVAVVPAHGPPASQTALGSVPSRRPVAAATVPGPVAAPPCARATVGGAAGICAGTFAPSSLSGRTGYSAAGPGFPGAARAPGSAGTSAPAPSAEPSAAAAAAGAATTTTTRNGAEQAVGAPPSVAVGVGQVITVSLPAVPSVVWSPPAQVPATGARRPAPPERSGWSTARATHARARRPPPGWPPVPDRSS